MEELVRQIIDRVRDNKLFYKANQLWHVAIENDGEYWTARLLRDDAEEKTYALVITGDTEATMTKALARLDRRVALMVYTYEQREHAEKLTRQRATGATERG